ncbi:MAG TPA: sugar ABC transporter permease [Acholeplasmataceae bacterium]|jgi:multiple sugar transport system permease protein|nr:sugar ABC transporter permease [Acholeplasmataceae bacterium]HPX71951.1 sugar ABC transporter permease [Acholeplasmataceae bacterium]HQC30359.1 sugar ABC transporter permease [Acholeplasmataceae bacterium]
MRGTIRKKFNRHNELSGILFVLPLIIYFLIFQVMPMLMAFGISFTDWKIIDKPKFVGLTNYIQLFTDSYLYPYFWRSLLTTVIYILLTVPFSIAITLVVSAILNSNIKGEGVFKTIFYIPSVTAGAAVAATWKFMVDPQYGLINQILGTNFSLLSNKYTALPTLAFMSVWGGLGYNVLIMHAAMKGINKELYDAAAIDGAGFIKTFFKVTIPSVKPIILFLSVTSLIGGFQAFDQMYFMTGGGPNKATLTYMYQVYNLVNLEIPNMGAASAMSYILLLIILGVTAVQFFLARERGEDRE